MENVAYQAVLHWDTLAESPRILILVRNQPGSDIYVGKFFPSNHYYGNNSNFALQYFVLNLSTPTYDLYAIAVRVVQVG